MTESHTPRPGAEDLRSQQVVTRAVQHLEVVLVDQLAQAMQLRELPPDQERDEAIAALHNIRNQIAHGNMNWAHGGATWNAAIKPIVTQVLVHLARIEQSSLGTQRARGIRQQTPPDVISEILNRSDSATGSADAQPDDDVLPGEAAATSTVTLVEVADLLSGYPGREREAEQAWRIAAAAGESRAWFGLAEWLQRQPGRECDVEHVYREAAAAGHTGALIELADWLRAQPGRHSEALEIYRDLVARNSR